MSTHGVGSHAGRRSAGLRLPRSHRYEIHAAVVAVTAALAVASGLLFVWPPTDVARHADAVVILGPGRHGERLTKGLDLVERGVAPVVVVSRSRRRGKWPLEETLCARGRSYCFQARPFTTRGEARYVARLAAINHWSSVVVVTSSYHVVRARLLYGRCLGSRVSVVAARPSMSPSGLVRAIVHEWGGLAYAFAFARGC
jgi:uncharacterized SAM-binding protein YcdF (DUF218 family)